jgi:hypothetical protein
MPITRPRLTDPAGLVARVLVARVLVALVLVALSGVGLTACSTDDAPPPAPAATRTAAPRDVAREVTRALDRRAAAVRRHDAAAFEAGLARRAVLARQQRTYFANLAQLPLARFRYEVDPASLVRDGTGYWVGVRLLMQIDGYDALPVAAVDRFRFVPARRGPDRMLLAAVTDADWERDNHVPQQPWDRGPIEVRTGAGVLGIFDPQSVTDAPDLLASVQSGISAVAAEVPYDWSRSVVVYALADPAYLDTLQGLPGDPTRLDGVAFPVPAAQSGRLAATRFLLSPSMLGRPGAARDRLVRHELTHVAVGEHDDRAPVWLAEGIAEWVSVRPVAPQDRLISGEAVAAARRGLTGLPADDTFNDTSSRANYAVSWWACERLAQGGGAEVLFDLLDAYDSREVEGRAARDRVLLERTGLDEATLARAAGRLILATYTPDAAAGR